MHLKVFTRVQRKMRRGQRNKGLISPPLAASGVMQQKRWHVGPNTHPALVSSHLLQSVLSSSTAVVPSELSAEPRLEIRVALRAKG